MAVDWLKIVICSDGSFLHTNASEDCLIWGGPGPLDTVVPGYKATVCRWGVPKDFIFALTYNLQYLRYTKAIQFSFHTTSSTFVLIEYSLYLLDIMASCMIDAIDRLLHGGFELVFSDLWFFCMLSAIKQKSFMFEIDCVCVCCE